MAKKNSCSYCLFVSFIILHAGGDASIFPLSEILDNNYNTLDAPHHDNTNTNINVNTNNTSTPNTSTDTPFSPNSTQPFTKRRKTGEEEQHLSNTNITNPNANTTTNTNTHTDLSNNNNSNTNNNNNNSLSTLVVPIVPPKDEYESILEDYQITGGKIVRGELNGIDGKSPKTLLEIGVLRDKPGRGDRSMSHSCR